MKKAMIILAALVLGAPAVSAQGTYAGSDPVGTLSYALPSTVISLEVEAVQEHFSAGPYAKYAKKYLGIDARQADETVSRVTAVRMTPRVEADQSKRFLITPGKGGASFLALTAQGLISTGDGSTEGTQWRFPTSSKGDFADRGVSSNLTSESATLYKNVKNETAYSKVAVQQEMMVEKPLETRAREAAEMLFNLRKKRVQIVTGDTDATYSGEAMGAAIAEISRMEAEYLSMFIGYSEYQNQKMNYDVVPAVDSKKQIYVAFRLSDAEGLVPADNVSGKPYVLELVPQPITAAPASRGAASRGTVAYYRIPAICTAKLSDGVNVLLQSRIPVYQLGIESSFPISEK